MPRTPLPGFRLLLSPLLLMVFLAGCATSGSVRLGAPATNTDELWKEYCAAVEATRQPSAQNLSRSLVALVHSTPKLAWNDKGQVLMATLNHQDCTKKPITCPDAAGKELALGGETWMTATPFLRDFCHGMPAQDVGMRLAQRLGLPPSSAGYYDTVVQLWVDPAAFFRPCADPEVTDGECQLNLTTGPSAGGGCPWADSYAKQTSNAFVQVSQAHLDWMCTNWTNTYTPTCQPGTTNLPYPWTGLGYTWDWSPGNPRHHGESEFVAPKSTKVTVESVTPLTAYCTP